MKIGAHTLRRIFQIFLDSNRATKNHIWNPNNIAAQRQLSMRTPKSQLFNSIQVFKTIIYKIKSYSLIVNEY